MDGGYHVCEDPEVAPVKPCLVYSFGYVRKATMVYTNSNKPHQAAQSHSQAKKTLFDFITAIVNAVERLA